MQFNLHHNEQVYNLSPLLSLLNALDKCGNLRSAAKLCHFSYRKAWNLIQQFEHIIGQPLINKQRGKGSKLSEFGNALLTLEKQNKSVTFQQLADLDLQANKQLASLLPASQLIKIIASDSEKLKPLRHHGSNIELETEGSGHALSNYADSKCDLAGFHIAAGGNNQKQLTEFCQYLDPKQDQFVILESREQGLISHPDRPVESLQQIVDQQLVFVNRQIDSGTRLLLDTLLSSQQIKPDQLPGYYHEEHTHLAVASLISSRQADAGLGIKTVAQHLKLHFVAINQELYFLVFKSSNTKLVDLLKPLLAPQSLEILDFKSFLARIS